MHKSKRNKIVTLSKIKKKGREHNKEQLVNAIRQSVEDYTSTYVFRFENMRNLKFKNFREQLKSNSRFYMGSNKVMQVALGLTLLDEVSSGIFKLLKFVGGNTDLFLPTIQRRGHKVI
ncbi:hypothetical protein ZOSMA_273G00120 [Zostera marina]|uniref:Ribosome assembly factor mrt4 n=1 Tax=Zostera marina TaxID=29655 RepID=A0A0K9PE09_ZOSMR|nr:hypothetical protein ZOSMA_273G00120 [Zostera marina]